jgi:hypothetical protein
MKEYALVLDSVKSKRSQKAKVEARRAIMEKNFAEKKEEYTNHQIK